LQCRLVGVEPETVHRRNRIGRHDDGGPALAGHSHLAADERERFGHVHLLLIRSPDDLDCVPAVGRGHGGADRGEDRGGRRGARIDPKRGQYAAVLERLEAGATASGFHIAAGHGECLRLEQLPWTQLLPFLLMRDCRGDARHGKSPSLASQQLVHRDDAIACQRPAKVSCTARRSCCAAPPFHVFTPFPARRPPPLIRKVLIDRQTISRHLVWIVVVVLATTAAAVWYAQHAQLIGRLPGGASLPGLVFGVAAAAIMVFELLLWPRKLLRRWR